MSLPDAEEIKHGLTQALNQFLKFRISFNEGRNGLKALGVRINTLEIDSSDAPVVVSQYYNALCQKLSVEYSRGTSHKIETPRFRQFQYSSDTSNAEIADSIARYLDEQDFSKIAEELASKCHEAESQGLKVDAKQICYSFLGRNAEIKPKYMVSEIFKAHYAYDRLESLSTLNSLLRLLEKHTGISFGSALQECTDATRSLTLVENDLPSRTVFGRGNHLELHCFKSKFELRFSQAAYEALFAFVLINGDEDCTQKVFALQGKAAA